MSVKYMESVWWGFKTLYDRGLVYRDFKVMPYSTVCATPLSNFEANLNYKPVRDPAIIVSFPLVDMDASMLAWTTTPWTLLSNRALCVNPNLIYVKIRDNKTSSNWILCSTRLEALYANKKKEQQQDEAKKPYQVLAEYKGAELKNYRYQPIFAHFADNKAFRVLCDTFVTDESGTGVVHCAPAFGEDDYRVCAEAKIEIVCPVDAHGCFTLQIPEYKGRFVKECDLDIIRDVKRSGRLIRQGQIEHNYPFCWRSDTPLIYKAVPSWFIRVETIRDRLMDKNSKIHWVPSHVGEKRFHNWLKDARDWAVSRNRYWGTPLPVWTSEDGKETIVIGSIAELESRADQKATINDLHRDKIDHLTLGSGRLKRIPEVFDCWFESGSMPFAQHHYPFENKDKFEQGFPADFIAEGLDQTRGWFYTLLVLSVGLFDRAAFQNVIVNGLILAADGKKMAKRLRNYPDPMLIMREHGADALRLYLISSPAVNAEPLRFQAEGVREVVKKVLLPWYNSFCFLMQQPPFVACSKTAMSSENVMDQWILASLNGLVEFVRKEMMPSYRLYTVMPQLLLFLEKLSKWYVRINRKRFKSGDISALSTLFEVLFALSKLMAPFTPFIVESMYQKLRLRFPMRQETVLESVHYHSIPSATKNTCSKLEAAMSHFIAVVELTRQIRETNNLALKRPLKNMTIIHSDQKALEHIKSLQSYVKEECNVRHLEFTSDVAHFVTFKAEAVGSRLGARFGPRFAAFKQQLAKTSQEVLFALHQTGKCQIEGETLSREDIKLQLLFKTDAVSKSANAGELLIVADTELTTDLMEEWTMRELISRVQKLRKKCALQASEPIEVFFETANKQIEDIIMRKQKLVINSRYRMPWAVSLGVEDKAGIKIDITRPCVAVHRKNIEAECRRLHQTAEFAEIMTAWLSYKDPSLMREDSTIETTLDGIHVTVRCGFHFFRSAASLFHFESQ